MLTPEGRSGTNTDKVMLLSMWANTLKKERQDNTQSFIFAGMGKPTYPINSHTVEMYLKYWNTIDASLRQIKKPDEAPDAALTYGDPRGEHAALTMMAEAMTKWYRSSIEPEHLLFTVGGAGALRVIFETLNEINKDTPHYRVLTPFPHYTLYADNKHQLHPIDVMNVQGYRLTADALESSIQAAYKLAEKDNNLPRALLLSNPSNPLGTVISESEWLELATVLRNYPDLNIIIDEAYAEMYWGESKPASLIELAPDLKDRVILLRSATKALSAAGERMAVLMAFNNELMSKLRDKNIGAIGHAPRSAQLAYAYTMANFTDDDREALKNYYKPKVDYIFNCLKEMGAAMPDPSYNIEGTFYVLGDFSDLLGENIPLDAKRALGKEGVIETNEELAYSLLFSESLMLTPGAYFGMPSKNGYLRITCSETREELEEVMHRLQGRLFLARQSKLNQLMQQITTQLEALKVVNPDYYEHCAVKYQKILNITNDCLLLKEKNKELAELLTSIKVTLKKSTGFGKAHSAQVVYNFLRHNLIEHRKEQQQEEIKQEWHAFILERTTEGALRNYFLNMSEQEKQSYKPWTDYLNSLEDKQNSRPL